MDTYEKKYKEIVGLIKKAYLYAQTDSTKAVLEEIFPELKESEDERIRKAIHIYLNWLDGRNKDYQPKGDYSIKDMIAWLEKQGKYANFRNKIQVGDKVTRNRDGVLVNLSQLKKVAKPTEKQGEQKASYTTIVETGDGGINALVTGELPTDSEQKPVNKVEPKFNAGDWVVISTSDGEKVVQIDSIEYFKSGEPRYITSEGRWFGNGTKARLLTDKDVETITLPENKIIVNQKPAWSEEDEQHIDSLLKRLDGLCRNEFERTRFAINEDEDWLKSLKQRIGG